jgi:starch-binding outer membrane protein, SusD/RagB family
MSRETSRSASQTLRRLATSSVLLLSVGCNEDILDVTPTDQYSDAVVWSDLALVKQFVDQTYGTFAPGGGAPTSVGINSGFALVDCVGLSDEAYNTHNYCNSNAVNQGTLSSTQASWNPWTGNYTNIRRVNLFMTEIEKVPGNEEQKATLTGEMRFLRANKYVELAKAYGAVPLITKVFGLDEDFEVPRTPFNEVVAFIVKELDEAIPMLPAATSGATLGRADRRAALALKADILLYAASPLHNPNNDQAKWLAASNAAKAVIDLPGHSLWTGDYKQLFLQTWKPEVIFGRVYNKEFETHDGFERNVATNGYGGWSAHTPIQSHVDAYEMAATGKPITDPSSGYDPADPYAGRDPRFYANIVFDDAMFWGRRAEFWDGGKDSNKGIQPWNASLTGYVYRKWFDESRVLGSARTSSGVPNRVWAIYRLAEMYLNYAEAQYRLGNEATAREYVNRVRTRPGVNMPPITASGTALLKAIEHERRIELAFEFKRFWDLLRWKQAEVELSKPATGVFITRNAAGVKTYAYDCATSKKCLHQTRKFNPYMYFFPIPSAELLRSKALTQNPGYP